MTATIQNWIKRQTALAILISATLSADMQSSTASNCAFANITSFAKSFENQPDIRPEYIQLPLKQTEVFVKGNEPAIKTGEIMEPSLVIKKALKLKNKYELSVNTSASDRIILRDRNGEYLIILNFDKNNCWKLTEIENWSLDKHLAFINSNDPALIAIARGNIYDQLANNTQSDSRADLYTSALDSYLYAANLGSARAAYLAAGISLSGQAPRLDNQQLLALLLKASYSEPDAGIALADFYCDEGEYSENQSCANPRKSIEALQRSARLGSSTALVELGSAYDSGSLIKRDPARAMACYLKAQLMGAEGLQQSINNLQKNGVAANSSIECL